MKILVTYKSKTGFTKKYAEWIAEDNKLGDTPLYYFESGTNPPKMGFTGRKVRQV